MNLFIYSILIFFCLSSSMPLFGGPKVDFLKASLQGDLATVKKLLDQEGAKLVYLRDKNKNTPLHLACYAKKGGEKEALIKLLIARGADLNARNDRLATALHIAIETRNHKGACALLHSAHIEPNYCDIRSYTPLHEAIKLRDLSLIKLLLLCRVTHPDVPTSDGATPLHFAAMWGFDQEASLLLADQRTNPNAQQHAGDYIGATPLHFAALQAQPKIVKLLLERKADFTLVISKGLFKGFTPLHFAAMNPDTINVVKTVELLLKAGANPKTRSALGKRPIDLTSVQLVQHCLERKPLFSGQPQEEHLSQ